MVMHLHLILGGRMNFPVSLCHDLVLQTAFQLRDPLALGVFGKKIGRLIRIQIRQGLGNIKKFLGLTELLQATEKITRVLVRRQGVPVGGKVLVVFLRHRLHRE